MLTIDLAGRTAVVTGGTRGLGAAAARALHAAGAQVVATTRRTAEQAASSQVAAVEYLDLRDEAGIEPFLHRITADYGPIDVLVNNAGVYTDQPVLSGAVADWDEMITVNLTGPMLTSRAVARSAAGRPVSIVNVGSVYSVFGHPMSAGYAASKAGVVGLTKSLAAELGPAGIRVNCILPGWLRTEINGDLPQTPRGAQIVHRTPVGRWGEPDDVGAAVAFLASDLARFVSGALLTVDGGYTASDREVTAPG